jgi:Methyltransferase FkbM domain
MSTEWIDRVRGSGRFGADWTDRATVPVTTLDALIGRYGTPSFCKIDVEGYEEAALTGLSTPVRAISLEFTPEYLDSTERALAKLQELAEYRFNYSLGDSLELAEGRWLSRSDVLARLCTYGARSFGDVYARTI